MTLSLEKMCCLGPKHIPAIQPMLVWSPKTLPIVSCARENRELAERLSNALDSGYAYVQGKRAFELTYKSSPRLLVVNTPHENTVKVSHWVRDFMLDVKRQRATELFRLCASEMQVYNETMDATRERDESREATREMNRENMESTQEMHETMEVGENQIVDGENGIAARQDQMGDEENGIAAAGGENGIIPPTPPTIKW
ncbi:hypothetical protein TNCV_1236451 [Trichonephila clavipes]|nr:hypothetical protein TNCV_1236451 [Trichonephila clavipes]